MCVCVCVCVHERAFARRRVVCVRDRRVCAFSIVRCLDVLCAFAVTPLVRAQPSRVGETGASCNKINSFKYCSSVDCPFETFMVPI